MEKLIQFCTNASLYDGAFDSKVGWAAAGMGYIIKTKSNSFIVIDGGHREDAYALIATLEKYSNGSRPCVALWIVTHAHDDHYEALLEISQNPSLLSRLEIQKIAYYFPNEYLDRAGSYCNAEPNNDMLSIIEVLKAQTFKPERDERLNIDGTEIHFMYVPDDCSLINRSSNANACSLIFKICFTNGKTLMITGDATTRTLQITAWRYGEALKSDALQMPHHALCDTGNYDFYRSVNAPTLLLPTSIAGDRAMSEIYFEKNEKNRFAYKNAKSIIKAYKGTKEINI